jgi:dynein heavy chain
MLARWILMIDPKLQVIKWIKEKAKDNGLNLLIMNNKKLISIVGECMEDGKIVILENLDDMIDAILSPIIGRNVYKKNYMNSVTTNMKYINISDLFGIEIIKST